MHPLTDQILQYIALAIFVLALGHTFAAKAEISLQAKLEAPAP